MAKRGRPKKTVEKSEKPVASYMEKISKEVENNQSKLSAVLGGLIILVIGILIFNYFNKGKNDLGPAQNTTMENDEKSQDVDPDKLPGKYTVKDGDTLFIIAEKYYQDGSRFEDLAKANNITDVNSVTAGQVLEIPKLEEASPSPSPEESSPSPSPSENPSTTPSST